MNKTNNTKISGAPEGKDRATLTPLKTGEELRCPRRLSSFCSFVMLLLLQTRW